jgi:hypothetical protein
LSNSVGVVSGAPLSNLGEGPLWDKVRSSLHWVDITACLLHALNSDGTTTSRLFDREITAVATHVSGDLIAALCDGIVFVGNEIRPITPPLRDDPEQRMNDGKSDPVDRFLIGSMRYDIALGGGALFSLGFTGELRTLIPHVTIANGWTGHWMALGFTSPIRLRRQSPNFPTIWIRATSQPTAVDSKIRAAVAAVAADRGVPRAQIALAWVCLNPVVTALFLVPPNSAILMTPLHPLISILVQKRSNS